MTGRPAPTIVVSDDHPLLLHGLCDLLRAEPDFRIVGSSTSGVEALGLVQRTRPEIALLDVSMPDLGGLAILKALRQGGSGAKVVFLSATLTGVQISEALSLGICGLLLKECAPDTLIDCLRHVASGGKWLPAELLERAAIVPARNAPGMSSLTRREREITNWVCRGLSNKAIATKLGTTDGTVKVHLHNIYQKLGIDNRMALAALKFQWTEGGLCE
ncbi:response regulator transcription factor [Sphingosinicella sp. BN140058]|uniref:response regulator n=1 Tax=Sphingosinicella sp. BN140058 TaxID=1892855 RepID=UPI0010106478|nr:response regulator transcription factor [Sphingosinicella sp. BN140058]QAY78085.1 response regulator transcription factor [Sphingosinicella sp. BN140058]